MNKKNKTQEFKNSKFYKNIGYIACVVVAAFAIAVICGLIVASNIRQHKINSFDFPLLDDNIKVVEDAIGDYAEYYVKIENKNNKIVHDIATFGIGDDLIFLVPLDLDDIVILDFYTCWDENLGTYVADFEDGKEYKVKDKTIKLVKSKLPFVFMNVDKNDLNKVNGSYTYDNPKKEKAYVLLTSYEPLAKNVTIAATISPRGSSSWTLFEKKPYSIKFEDNCDPFDLVADKKFNFLANAFDKSLMKNEIMFYFGNMLEMEYTPYIKNVNMYFNDSYQGVYSVSTKIKVGKNTIDLSDGDFLFSWGASRIDHKIDYTCNFWTNDVEDAITTGESSSFINLEWPEDGAITPTLERNVQRVVQNYIDSLEGRTNVELSDCVDFESLAKYYWVQEIMMNADAWYRSAYMYYKHDDQKLHMGPLWDGDMTFNTLNNKEGSDFSNPTGWKIRTVGYYVPLFENEEFVKEVNRVYKDYDIEKLMYKSYDQFVARTKDISVEGELNYQLWANDNSNTVEPDKYEDNPTYLEYCNKKAEFYKQRIDWIAQEMRK